MVNVIAQWDPAGDMDFSGRLVSILSISDEGGKSAVLGQSKRQLEFVSLFSALLEQLNTTFTAFGKEAKEGDMTGALVDFLVKAEFEQYQRCREKGEPYRPLLREHMKDEVNEHWKTSEGVPGDTKGERAPAEPKEKRTDPFDPRSWKGM